MAKNAIFKRFNGTTWIDYHFQTSADLVLGLENYAKGDVGIYWVLGNTTGTAGVWTGSNPKIISLFTGLTIVYRVGIAGVSGGTTLNINGLGAKNVRRNNSNVTTHYPAGTVLRLTYDGTYWQTSDYTVSYSNMTAAELTTGTATSSRLISAKTLRGAFYTKGEVDTKITSYALSDDVDEMYQDLTGLISDLAVETDPTVPAHVKAITTTNINAWNNKSNFSGSYNDLTNKPTIPPAYNLPTATETVLGGVKPVAKTTAMTQDVGVDSSGKLYTAPGSGGGGELDSSVELIRSRTNNAALTSTGAGNADTIKITMDEGKTVEAHDNLIVEVYNGSSASNRTRLVPFKLYGSSSATTNLETFTMAGVNVVGSDIIISPIRYHFMAFRNTDGTLSFGSKYRSIISSDGSYTNSTYTLYVGRIWRIKK